MNTRLARGLAWAGLVSWIAVSILFVLSLIAILGSLGATQQAIDGDISGVVEHLARARVFLILQAIPATISGVTIYLGVFRWRARGRWLYRVGLLVSILSLIVFPTGTICGVVGLVHLRKKRSEYLSV